MAILAVLLGIAGAPARAQGPELPFPSRPIRMILPFTTGSPPGSVLRATAEDMLQRLDQLVVIDPRPGSARVVAASALLNAPADGYTIALLGTPPAATLPHVQRNLSYRVEQLQPETNVIQGAFYLTVTADTPATNIRDLATITRRSPSPTLFVVVGIGSSPHLLMSVFARHSGANVEPVVYRSESLGAADMISGRVSMLMGTLVPVLDFAREGKLRILATTAPQRLGILPEVPTVAEAGFPEIEMVYWDGFFVSSKCRVILSSSLMPLW